MAKYKVTGPDGKSYNVTVPDGVSADEAMDYAQQQFAKMQPASVAAAKPDVSAWESAARGVGQGLTFNWGDELYGYGANLPKLLTDGKDAYLEAARKDTADVRAANKRAQEANPKAYLGGEVGGSVLPVVAGLLAAPFTGGASAAPAAATAARATTMGAKMLSGAKTGAAFGAVSGAGAAESSPDADAVTTAADTAAGAVKGGLFGGAIGAAAPPVIAAGSSVLKAATRPITNAMNPEGFAAEKVAEAIRRGNPGVSSAELDRIASDQAKMAPGSIMADLGGDPTHKLMRAAINTPNTETTAFQKALDARQQGQFRTIEDKLIQPIYGDVKNFETARRALIDKRAQEATPAFEAAFKGDFVPSPELQKALQSRAIFSGRTTPTGETQMSPLMKAVDNYFDTKYGADYQPTAMETFHQIKVRLDKLINWDRNRYDPETVQLASALGMDQSALKSARAALMDGLEKSQGSAVGKYQDALKRYGDDTGIIKAMDLGYAHGRGQSPEALAEQLWRNATEQERAAYKLGMGRAVYEQNLAGRYNVDRVGRDWDSPLRDRQLQAVLPAPAPPLPGQPYAHPAYERVQAVKDALDRQTATRRAAQGNSTTAAQLKADQDAAQQAEHVIETGKALASAATGNFGGLLRMGEGIARRYQGITPRTAAEVLKLLGHEVMPHSGMAATRGGYLNPAVQAAIQRQVEAEARYPAIMRGLLAGTTTGINSQ